MGKLGIEQTGTEQTREGQSGLEDALRNYGKSDFYPYHMPGHKRSQKMGAWSDIFQIDITEIDGFDNLHQAEGMIKQAQERAAKLYGAEETFFLVNGSTCGVLSAILSVTQKQDTILIARNCHKSVYHAAFLQELQLRYLYPEQIAEYGIADAIGPEEVEEALIKYPECKAVVITSPTYEGIIADIRSIAQVVHKYEKVLIVDEAHGAHLGMADNMPSNAAKLGADLVINSLHKTLPAMTQTALLHVNGKRVNRKKLRRYLSMLQTSSPSYVFMANMDSCISHMKENADTYFEKMQSYHCKFMMRMKACKHICVGNTELIYNRGYHLIGWDIGKLVISVKNTDRRDMSGNIVSMSGQQLYDILRDEFHLQMEMAADSYVLAMMTVMDDEEGWQRLADALLQIDDRIEVGAEECEDCRGNLKLREAQRIDIQEIGCQKVETQNPTAKMTIAEAFAALYDEEGSLQEIPFAHAEGKIVGDFVNLYPPGIPILVPGEVIGAREIQMIQESLRMGLHVQGISETETVMICRRKN